MHLRNFHIIFTSFLPNLKWKDTMIAANISSFLFQSHHLQIWPLREIFLGDDSCKAYDRNHSLGSVKILGKGTNHSCHQMHLHRNVLQWMVQDIYNKILSQCIPLDKCHCLNMGSWYRDSVERANKILKRNHTDKIYRKHCGLMQTLRNLKSSITVARSVTWKHWPAF